MTFLQKRLFLLLVAAIALFISTSFSQQSSLFGQAPAVTISEYTDFLNCVGATDTYGLYNNRMGDDEGIGAIITRSGKPGNYTYSYNPEKASFPVTYVSWFSAIRYCNWRSHHGPTGLQDRSTTEAGSYDLTAFDQGGDISTIVLAPGATFFLPTNYLVDTTFQNLASKSTDAANNGVAPVLASSSINDTLSRSVPSTPCSLLASATLNSCFTDSSAQSCDPYLASGRLGFCFTTWNANSSSADSAAGNSGSDKQGGLGVKGSDGLSGSAPGSSSVIQSTARDATFNTPSSIGIAMLGDASPNSKSNQINISLVVVGAPNNSADVAASGTNKTATNQVGYGSVLMPYQMGTYDVTAEQYCAFLNAVANKTDLHGLYNTNMSSDPDVACITRSGDASSGYSYTPMSGRKKFPVTYVTWYAALRFCNWLENGQPTGGNPDMATENGSYNIAAIPNWTPKSDTDYSLLPNPGTAWALPTENQWYKAAYYIPSTSLTNGTNSTNGVYCAFGTGSMDAPGNQWEKAGVTNRANYALNGSFTTTNQPRIMQVGSFINSASPWGAYDMAGELNQWTSTFDVSGNYVITRGGSWKSQTSDDLKATARFSNSVVGSPTVGFRVVYNIPPAPTITHLDMTNDLVAVRDPNNKYDDAEIEGGVSFGSVPTEYQIGKYDITAEQYCMFLNAVAAHADPHQLYRPEMTSDSNVACIIRYGNTNRGYSYFPWPGREKFPITYVSWFSALRFCNWLENDQPIGAESPETTESGSFTQNDQGAFTVSTNHPKWLLPTENQWYKAAYYQPAQDGFSELYYSFGTASFAVPNNSLLDNATNAANYCCNGHFTTPTVPHLTPVGAFKTTKSTYGAYDMAGEVNQWTLTPLSADTSKLVVRGGSWQSTNPGDLRFSAAQFINANQASNTIGFRLVYNVPPPPPQPPTWREVGRKIYHNVKTTLYEDGKDLAMGKAGTDPEVSNRYFGYVTGPFIAGIYKWGINAATLLFRNICLFFQRILESSLPESVMQMLNGWFKVFYEFFFKSMGVAAGEADFAELTLAESLFTSAGEYTMLMANPPVATAILLTSLFTYAAYESLQKNDPRAGISFASLDIGYILGIVKLLLW